MNDISSERPASQATCHSRAEPQEALRPPAECQAQIATKGVKYDPDYPYFGLVGEPVEHKQHRNQQKGLDLYVRVINFETGEPCFKKLYDGKQVLHFKHTGYSPMYLHDFTQDATVVPFQVLFPADAT